MIPKLVERLSLCRLENISFELVFVQNTGALYANIYTYNGERNTEQFENIISTILISTVSDINTGVVHKVIFKIHFYQPGHWYDNTKKITFHTE